MGEYFRTQDEDLPQPFGWRWLSESASWDGGYIEKYVLHPQAALVSLDLFRLVSVSKVKWTLWNHSSRTSKSPFTEIRGKNTLCWRITLTLIFSWPTCLIPERSGIANMVPIHPPWWCWHRDLHRGCRIITKKVRYLPGFFRRLASNP